MKQIKFRGLKSNTSIGGILLNNGDIICGDCGGMLLADQKDISYKIEKVYDDWVNLSDEILGGEKD